LILSTDGGLKATDALAGAWCYKDFILQNRRLTGTRFAKIEWIAPTVGAQLKVSINDKWWILRATAAGAQTTIIDLCRPNCTGGGNIGPLQYRGTDGKLLYNVGSGKLMGECCCGDCDTPDQLQSIIPVELPKHLTTPPSGHEHDLGIGWGIGRVGEVRFDFLTAGTFTISNVKLYRKAAIDGGFCKIWLNPQSAYNNGRAETDPAVFHAGDAVVDGSITTCYLYRSGIIVVDGAVVGEVIMGGPQYLGTGSYPGWLWDWESLSTLAPDSRIYFPCVPYDSYETPTEGPYANGVVAITLLEPPNYAGIPCIPGCFAPQLDPVRSDLVDLQNLTATLQFDIAKYPCGFGSSIGGIRKMLRGIITGLAYSGRSPYALQNVKVIEDGGGFWNELTNKLGWFASAKVRGTGEATVDIITGGAHPAVTVHQRNRQYTRAVVER
jgi:hypothetical protein